MLTTLLVVRALHTSCARITSLPTTKLPDHGQIHDFDYILKDKLKITMQSYSLLCRLSSYKIWIFSSTFWIHNRCTFVFFGSWECLDQSSKVFATSIMAYCNAGCHWSNHRVQDLHGPIGEVGDTLSILVGFVQAQDEFGLFFNRSFLAHLMSSWPWTRDFLGDLVFGGRRSDAEDNFFFSRVSEASSSLLS
jgi:hypothetical protein